MRFRRAGSVLVLVSVVLVTSGCAMPGQAPPDRLTVPRVAPLERGEWTDEQEAILGPLQEQGRLLNIFRTLARSPDLYQSWIPFGAYILSRSKVPPRDRELAILRIGWLCRAEYEFGQHTRVGQRVGISKEEIERVTRGPEASGWTDFERNLLRAVDELHNDAFITDGTWEALALEYDERQLMDLVFTVAQYNLVSMVLNTLGVQLEPGVTGFPQESRGAAR